MVSVEVGYFSLLPVTAEGLQSCERLLFLYILFDYRLN